MIGRCRAGPAKLRKQPGRRMALVQRSEHFSMDSAPDGDAVPSSGSHSAGEVLRRQREALGLEIVDVAAVLRIKPAYIAALEAGHPDQLPGPAYAVGFMRAYADYLGLDVGKVLRRFKQEPIGLSAKPELSFPMPLGEHNTSTRAALLVVVILAICGYGTWYYFSTGEDHHLERVGEVPPELLPLRAAPPLSGSTPSPTAPASAGADPPRPPVARPAPVLPTARETTQIPKGIVVHATADSWVEIRDARRSVLIARVLKAGEDYRVPNQRGLSMRTGNAGALEITCDGNPVPPIGRTGMIRRDVALDPQALITGSAVRN
jgi:cytoskeleton protein RodZ